MSQSIEKFKQIITEDRIREKQKPFSKRNLCYPPIDAQLAFDCLLETFLGEKWFSVMPQSQEQVNTEALFDILYKHNREFKKWFIEMQKEV